MKSILPTMCLLLVCACAGSTDLSKDERSKIDPAIMKLLSEPSIDETVYDVGRRDDGTKEYGVILRVTTTDELRSAGIRIQSVFGNVATARLTVKELRTILSLPSVRSVENGSRNYPQ
jgi:hypothetical protein